MLVTQLFLLKTNYSKGRFNALTLARARGRAGTAGAVGPLKVKLHYAYKVRNIGRVRAILRYCVV